VKLYVCWGTFPAPWRPGGHPCRNAYNALREAGWVPEVKKVYGLGPLPDFMNPTRSEVRALTGQNMVPLLVTDEGETIVDSKRIAEWARAHPASGGVSHPTV
jgi:Glutathione S-transferase, N-terminal domain